MKSLKNWVLYLVAVVASATGCAVNPIRLTETTGTNGVTTRVLEMSPKAIWPATSEISKQKASLGKTLSAGFDEAKQSGGGTNVADTIRALSGLLEVLPK